MLLLADYPENDAFAKFTTTTRLLIRQFQPTQNMTNTNCDQLAILRAASSHKQNLMKVDFEKVKQSKVKRFLLHHKLNDVTGFTKLESICYNPEVEASYQKHHQTFLIKNNVESVWHTYKTIHPKEAWNGEMVSFGVQYSKSSNSINYLNDHYTGMQQGQILVLNLKMFWGLLHLAVAHQVSEVNEQQRMIKLCYMKGGASEGSQWITLHETEEGFTEVSHLTLYKSKSKFRDTKLYPRLHAKAIAEFHGNVKRKAELINVEI